MISIIPKSLFGRLFAVLLLGLIIAQMASTFIVLLDRGQLLYDSIEENLINKTSGIALLLNSIPADSRESLLPLLSNKNLRLYLSDNAISGSNKEKSKSPAAQLVTQQLQRKLPQKTKVLVSLDGSLMGTAQMQNHMAKMMGKIPDHMAGKMHSMAFTFHIQIRLNDRSWIIFERGVDRALFNWPIKLLSVLVILLLSVIVLSYFAVKSLIQPLKQLRDAAEGLGKDILQQPLPENGPIEVQQTAKAFNTMQRRLRRYIDDRAHILSSISHDLKTPLTRLRLRAELLDDDEQRDKTLTDLDDMEMMVNATLDFMRGIANNEKNQAIDINALLESLQADAQELGHHIVLKGNANDLYFGKPVALKRCIENLLNNAVRYAHNVVMAVKQQSDSLIICICDDGPGIPESDLSQIFEPFYRLEKSRAKHTGGTGLGLGIARNIARAHGGDIVLFNKESGGLCADVQLPLLTVGA